jgi:hypothetical protein
MSNAYFVPDDFEDAYLSESPTMEAAMPSVYAQYDDRSYFARSTSIADQVITGHWATNNRYIDSLIIAQHTGYGGSIRLQLFSDSDSATGQVYDSGTVVIISALVVAESFAWGLAKLGLPLNDQLADEAAYSLFFSGVQCASFKLTFSSCQALYWQFGRIVMGRRVEAPYNPDHGMSFGPASNHDHNRKRGGGLDSRTAAAWNVLRANMFTCTDAERAAWLDLRKRLTNRTAGVSLFPGVGGRQERDHVDVMALAQHEANVWASPAFNESTVELLGI